MALVPLCNPTGWIVAPRTRPVSDPIRCGRTPDPSIGAVVRMLRLSTVFPPTALDGLHRSILGVSAPNGFTPPSRSVPSPWFQSAAALSACDACRLIILARVEVPRWFRPFSHAHFVLSSVSYFVGDPLNLPGLFLDLCYGSFTSQLSKWRSALWNCSPSMIFP
ncbi:hypothetical protein R1flu_018728 [Riccia fluitans]|uniref:Uncharacterized protein n=1 Tax=Riccia fluitans TaxID=41844 RepID=A0ABD1ZI27_9MARC